jgi:hypothetical protein
LADGVEDAPDDEDGDGGGGGGATMGAGCTVRRATIVVTLPFEFVKTAR